MKHSLYIAAIMLLVLILSQGYWLYNIYNAEKYKTQEVLEELFEEAIKQEMSKRMVSNKPKDPNNPKRIIRRASDMTPEERAKLKGDTIIWPQIKNRNLKDNYADLLAQRMQVPVWSQGHIARMDNYADLLAQRMQDGLRNANRPLKPNVLDSLFNKTLTDHNLQAISYIEISDSTRQTVNTVGKKFNLSFYKFQTEKLPIGTQGLQYVQAFVKLPLSDIVQRKLLAFIVSCLIILTSASCLYYLLRTIRKAHAQLRDREIAVHSAIHDLKSPLNTAYASMDLIASLENEPMKVNILNTGKTQIKQLIEIIESMLSLLKTADGKESARKSPIDIKSFIEQTYQAIARLYPNKIPLFKLEKSEDFPDMIEADTVRLERCLRNLLENALKYSNDDVRITVTLTMKNNHYRIAIKDTGWGIPKKAQKKLGQQFFRVKQADKPAQPGYGLGLSSVMLMAKEMGGSLTFQSEEGVGSTFFINLPAENS